MQIDVDYLRRLRRNKKMKIEQVAKLIGKSRSMLWRYENGQANMTAETLVKLAELYEVSLEKLITNKPLP